MKSKRIACIAMAGLMAASLAGCGGSDSDNKDTAEATKATTEAAGSDSADDTTADAEGIKSYADIQLGTDFTDLSAEIKFYNNRTDMDSDDYGGKNWKQYLEDFNKEYPNIKVDVITDTNYADDALTHLQSGNYETVMCIPAVDMADLSTYFMSFGDYDTMSSLVNYSNRWLYQGQVYGVPLAATTQGIVYNKKVFADAGVTDVPKTPEEFIAALKAIKEKNPKCIPLYTNYAAGWTMGAWDDYIAITATGDATYKNQKLAHTKDHSRTMATIHMLMQYIRSFTMQYHRDLQRMITQQQIGSQVRECSTTAISDVWYLVHGHTHRWKQADLTQTISDTFLSLSQ